MKNKKRLIALLLALFFCVSLSACGDAPVPEPIVEEQPQSTPSIGDQMYVKYKTIIDNLESEKYEDVIIEVSRMMPEPEETVIGITPDNFWDYYEIVYTDDYLTKDAAGNITDIWGTQEFRLRLKEEYLDIFVPDNSMLEIGLTADVVLKKVESVDWATGEYVLSNENYDDIESDIASFFSNNGKTCFSDVSATCSGNVVLNGNLSSELGMGFFHPHNDGWGTYYWQGDIKPNETYDALYIAVPENIQIVRAEGTLTFRGRI